MHTTAYPTFKSSNSSIFGLKKVAAGGLISLAALHSPAIAGVFASNEHLYSWMEQNRARLSFQFQDIQNLASVEKPKAQTESGNSFELDARTPAEHLVNIKNIFDPRMSDLATSFRVSRQTLYKWLSSEVKPEDANLSRLCALSRAGDYLARSEISRIDTLLNLKFDDGETLLSLSANGDVPKARLEQMVAACQRKLAEQKASTLHASKTSSDAVSTLLISPPGSFEEH